MNSVGDRQTGEVAQPAEEPAAGSVVRPGPGQLLLLAMWFGFFTGVGEALTMGAKRLLNTNPYMGFGPDVLWLSPLTETALFTGVGLLLAIMASRWPTLVTLKSALRVLGFLAFSSLFLLVLHRVNIYAKLVLAAGVASAGASMLAASPGILWGLIRVTMGWVVLPKTSRSGGVPGSRPRPSDSDPIDRRRFLLSQGVALTGLATAINGWDWLQERRTVAALPAVAGNPPNVILITLDTVRSMSLSLYGYERPTSPALERLAGMGVCFERAFATAPWTTPSHASMFTGRFPHELSIDWEAALDTQQPTLAEVLSEHGYVTAGFIANTERCSFESGLDRGFAHYEDYGVSAGQAIRTSPVRFVADRIREGRGDFEVPGRKSAARLNSDFLRWLTNRSENRPFFAFLNYYDAHDPYLPPEDFALRFAPAFHTVRYRDHGAFPDMPRGTVSLGDRYTPAQFRYLNDTYDGSIAYLDQQLGLLFSELEGRSVLENTVVIITSDHGEQFGEHGLPGHANSLYLQTLQVPLLILFPARVPRGQRIAHPVSLRDLANTVLDLAGIGGGPTFPGDSLARYMGTRSGDGSLDGPAPLAELQRGLRVPEWFPSAKGDMKALIAGNLHYILNGDGSEQLFDYVNDSLERNNLMETNAGVRDAARLRAAMKSLVAGLS